MNKKVKANTQSSVYSGDVKLTLKKGATVYKVITQHNAGTVDFFKYILNTVKGSVLINDRPGYVRLAYSTGESRYGTYFDEVTDAYETGTSEIPKATITYKFIIPDTVVERKVLTGLILESRSGVEYARVVLPQPISITSSTNIELEWNLNICNIN